LNPANWLRRDHKWKRFSHRRRMICRPMQKLPLPWSVKSTKAVPLPLKVKGLSWNLRNDHLAGTTGAAIAGPLRPPEVHKAATTTDHAVTRRPSAISRLVEDSVAPEIARLMRVAVMPLRLRSHRVRTGQFARKSRRDSRQIDGTTALLRRLPLRTTVDSGKVLPRIVRRSRDAVSALAPPRAAGVSWSGPQLR
jgi:hypothetical protein